MILKDQNNDNYIKKISAYEQYKDKNINNDLIGFYYQFNHLKNIYRQGWIKNLLGKEHIYEIESIADHSWSVSMLAISIINKYKLNYDITKCMELALIHELGEIYAGDFTPSDNVTKEKKHELEKNALEKLLNSISFENHFFELWEEYEKQETEESKFIRQLDKLECIMQASCYGLDISYMDTSKDNITLPYLKEIIKELQILTRDNEMPLNIKNTIDSELVKYIENEIFPLYDRKTHEIISAKMFMEDEKIRNWFTDEQIKIIKEAIEDHRASSGHKPRNIYGMIVSTADRTIIDIEDTIKRSYSYGIRHYDKLSNEEQIERVYQHLTEKYGENGYVKIYLEDSEFDEAIKKLRQALSNKTAFINRVKEVISKMNL